QPMHVAVADERFAVPRRPAFGAAIEVHGRREHRVALDGIEQRRLTIKPSGEARGGWKERMRCHDDAGDSSLESRQILERVNRFRAAEEIEQQAVPALNRPLDAWYQHDSTLRRVGREGPDVELTLV